MLLKHTDTPDQSFATFLASEMTVISGANDGDGLGDADDLVLDDIYSLVNPPLLHRLMLLCNDRGQYHIAPASEAGVIGAEVRLDCVVTLMSDDAPLTEVVILVQLDRDGATDEVFALPLGALKAQMNYQLIGVDTHKAALRLAQASCGSLTRGTVITTGKGRQKCIEDLKIGDPVLTRDNGIQRLRWIGHSTQRALGAFAPVRILAGALQNSYDLIVSANQRFLISRHPHQTGVGHSELHVKAADLVDGHSIRALSGGFVDYYQLVFDTREVIYAHGIAIETLPIDGRTAPLMPSEILNDFNIRRTSNAPILTHGTAACGHVAVDADIMDHLRNATLS
ncbi:Hint domain-containing protein [Roseobacter sp. EG26]|uniref:Hint domain-containing protein n=1 Tax=Roseobacter sp. EG26 TaxID=3412477 RepID=UPI003CE573FE